MPKQYFIDCICHALDNVAQAVQHDTYNLTRDDHDALESYINKLKLFIKGRYDKKSGIGSEWG